MWWSVDAVGQPAVAEEPVQVVETLTRLGGQTGQLRPDDLRVPDVEPVRGPGGDLDTSDLLALVDESRGGPGRGPETGVLVEYLGLLAAEALGATLHPSGHDLIVVRKGHGDVVDPYDVIGDVHAHVSEDTHAVAVVGVEGVGVATETDHALGHVGLSSAEGGGEAPQDRGVLCRELEGTGPRELVGVTGFGLHVPQDHVPGLFGTGGGGGEERDGEGQGGEHRSSWNAQSSVVGRRKNVLQNKKKFKLSWYTGFVMKSRVTSVICLFCLVLPGCGVVELGQTVDTENSDIQKVDAGQIPSSWETYQNTKYGYSVSYPPEAVIYIKVAEVDDRFYILTPTDDSEEIRITDASESDLMRGGTNTLSIQVISDARSGHEWISQHLSEYYPSGIGGQTNGSFAGEEAIVIRGTGQDDSPDKLIVMDHNSFVFVISFGQRSDTFDQIAKTFQLN